MSGLKARDGQSITSLAHTVTILFHVGIVWSKRVTLFASNLVTVLFADIVSF
jgi:hypothetical protein